MYEPKYRCTLCCVTAEIDPIYQHLVGAKHRNDNSSSTDVFLTKLFHFFQVFWPKFLNWKKRNNFVLEDEMQHIWYQPITGSPRLSKCNLVSSETNLGTFLTLLAVAAKTFFEVELVPVTLDSIGKRETTTKLSKR